MLGALEAEDALTEKSASRFRIVSRFLTPEGCLDYTIRQVSEDLAINMATCKKAIQRLRLQFREAVWQEVANYLKDPIEAAVTEEMIQLQKALIN